VGFGNLPNDALHNTSLRRLNVGHAAKD